MERERLLHVATYVQRLSVLTGNDFEDEVVAALQATYSGFQRVVATPHGDGGLDGLSHKRQIAYCCYGPMSPAEPGLTAAKRRDKLRELITTKFRGDLCRLLEVRADGGKPYAQRVNSTLEGILGKNPTVRIGTVRLVCNWIDDSRLLGALESTFTKARAASRFRFVDRDFEWVLWGPDDLAKQVLIDQRTLLRCENPSLLQIVDDSALQARGYEHEDAEQFDSKFDFMVRKNPAKAQSIDRLRDKFRSAWGMSITLDQRLARELPDMHRKYEAARHDAATEAELASIRNAVDGGRMISETRDRLRKKVGKLAGSGLPDEMSEAIADAETGRLIGECPLDWREDE